MWEKMGSWQTKKSNTQKHGQQQFEFPNYDFHTKKIHCVKPQIIEHINNWQNYNEKQMKKFYEDLEYDHSFIQWIFPNFFNSMFNSNSQRLTVEERNKMIMDIDAMQFFLKNYKMFLKFLGIDWNENELQLNNQKQFHKCLRINTHNQLRLKRVFASLSVLGQRKEALKLLNFIYKQDNELYGTEYYVYDHLLNEKEIKGKTEHIDSQRLNSTSYQFDGSELQNEKNKDQLRNQQEKIESYKNQQNLDNKNIEGKTELKKNDEIKVNPQQGAQNFHNNNQPYKDDHQETQFAIKKEETRNPTNTYHQKIPTDINKNDEYIKTKEDGTLKQPNETVFEKKNDELRTQQEKTESIKNQQQNFDQNEIKAPILNATEKLNNDRQQLNMKEEQGKDKDDFIELKIPKTNDTYLSKQNEISKIPEQQNYIEKKNFNYSSNGYFQNFQTDYKRPQLKNYQFEKFEDQFIFEKIKNNYVQYDLLKEKWVTVQLLSNQQVDLQSNQKGELQSNQQVVLESNQKGELQSNQQVVLESNQKGELQLNQQVDLQSNQKGELSSNQQVWNSKL